MQERAAIISQLNGVIQEKEQQLDQQTRQVRALTQELTLVRINKPTLNRGSNTFS